MIAMPEREFDPAADHQREKARPPARAQRHHRGTALWHLEVRSSVIICGDCDARLPRPGKPKHCPECGAGR
jgi:hypothetical protein